MTDLFRLLGPERRWYVLVTISMAIVTGSEVALHPILLKAIFDGVSEHRDFRSFIYLSLAYLALGLTVNPLVYFVSLWETRVDNRVVAHVSETMLTAYLAQDYNAIVEQSPGYYVARIRSDVRDGLVPLLRTLRETVVAAISFVLLITVLVYISWQAFLLLAVIIPFSTGVSIWVSRRIRILTSAERNSEASVLDVLTKSVNAFKIVRTYALENRTVGVFRASLRDALHSNYRKSRVVRSLQGIGDLTMVVSDVCSMTIGAYLVFQGRLTLGSFIAFMNAFWRAATTLITIFNKVADMHGYIATTERLTEFLDLPRAASRTNGGAGLKLADVRFSYTSHDALARLSLSAAPGERLLVEGRNGSGKTTLANVIAGYLAPSEGRIELPGRISGVTLPVNFPPLKVRELPIDEELLVLFELQAAAIQSAYPDALSAGQQQKVALAMALSRDADLYVLDEPLANLDTHSRTVAMAQIERRSQGRTLVMIMHDADQYRRFFDRVVTLEPPPTDRGSDADARDA